MKMKTYTYIFVEIIPQVCVTVGVLDSTILVDRSSLNLLHGTIKMPINIIVLCKMFSRWFFANKKLLSRSERRNLET